MKKKRFKSSVEFIGKWNGKELMKRNPFNNQECIASEPALADHYSKYYLEIHGWHDRDICKTIDCHTCKSKGVSMDKYNVLANDKEDVLLLTSDYPDFRDYQIMGTFYMDRECGEGNDYITIVHCYAEEDEVLSIAKFFRKFLHRNVLSKNHN